MKYITKSALVLKGGKFSGSRDGKKWLVNVSTNEPPWYGNTTVVVFKKDIPQLIDWLKEMERNTPK